MLTKIEKKRSYVILILTIGTLIFVNGCFNQPRVRFGTYAAPTLGTKYVDINKLGKHSYESGLFENSGIAYTCRGGHIDITHVRIGADYVKYLYEKTQKTLSQNDQEFTFNFNVEPSTYHVKIQYPSDWNNLSQKDREKISQDISLELSQYLTYVMVTWHEILTWFGYKSVGFYSEEPSAFSWEDVYSNLIGVRLGAKAVQDNRHTFNEAMTILLKEELENLQIQSSFTAKKAAEKMKGKWFNGYLIVEMLERNMDIGMDDGFVTPTLVPEICINAEAQSYPVPTLGNFDKSGFSMNLQLELREFERNKILKLIQPQNDKNIIMPVDNLVVVLDYIEKEAIKKGCNIMPHNSVDFASKPVNRQKELIYYHP